MQFRGGAGKVRRLQAIRRGGMHLRKILFMTVLLFASTGWAGETQPVGTYAPWWVWPILLFAVTLVIGIIAVLGGIGGGVLYVPIISGFFPFHLDFVRCTGLLVALSSSLAAGPGLLNANLASLRLAAPLALISSSSAMLGAMIGLALPAHMVQLCLGATILVICVIMLTAKKSLVPDVPKADCLSSMLRIHGVYFEPSIGETVEWKIHRTPQGLCLFVLIGMMAGMFGMGAGFVNVPVLNLLLGAPLKTSVATSNFLVSISGASAAWIYINKGCVIPLLVVPSLLGIMLGSFVGVHLLKVTRPASIRWLVIVVLAFAGCKALHRGLTYEAKEKAAVGGKIKDARAEEAAASDAGRCAAGVRGEQPARPGLRTKTH